MGGKTKEVCPECGKPLNGAYKRNGYRCNTNGCDIQKAFRNERGEICGVLRSTVAVGSLEYTVQVISDLLLEVEGKIVQGPPIPSKGGLR